MKSLKRGLLILGVAVVLLAVLFAFRWWQISAQREAMSAPPPPAAVEQVRAEPRSWPASLSAIGELRAVNGVRVANEIAGVVEELAFESGQRVEAGDMLLRLDAETDEAALETRQAEARLARQQFERFSDLVDQSAVSRAQFDEARASYEAAMARVHEQQALLDKKTVEAPFSGVLGLREVDLGEFLAVGTPIVEINMLDPIQVDFTIAEAQLPLIAVGDRVEVSVSAWPERVFSGRVLALESSVTAATRTVRVRASLDNSEQRLRPGMFAEVRTYQDRVREVVTVPRTAVSYNTYGDFVFVIADDGGSKTVQRRSVTTGEVRDGQVEVVDGLEAGTPVVAAGLLRLRGGQAVRVTAGSGDA